MRRVLHNCSENLLIWVAISFIAGASAAYNCTSLAGPSSLAAFVLPVLALLAVVACLLPANARPVTTLPFFFLVGLIHTHSALHPVLAPDDISMLVTEKTRATLTGRIRTLMEFDGEQTTFQLAADSILIHSDSGRSFPQPVRGTVQVTVLDDLPAAYMPGIKIMAIVTLDRVRSQQTPGVFDYRKHMAAKSIRCTGWIGSSDEILPVSEPMRSGWQRLPYLAEQARQRMTLFLGQNTDPKTASIYQALLIGSRAQISPELSEAFKDNGCMHILAISGLHLSLLGLFAAALFRFLLKRSQWLLLHTHIPTLSLVLTAPLLFFYAFVAGMNVPAFRALITALLVLVALTLRRQRSLTHLIAAAALIVLAIHPLALFTASFQLSFAAVLAINSIYPRLHLQIKNAHKSDADPGWPLRGYRFLQSMLYVSLAATIGTLPFMLYHFNRVSLIGPVMNLAIEPLLCLWALPWGLMAFPFVWICPDMAVLLISIGGMGIKLAVLLVETAARLPYASLWAITPTVFEIALFFTICFCLLSNGRTGEKRAVAAALTLIVAGSFTSSLWYTASSKPLTVSFLDVGQGASTLVQLPSGRNMLIDGGGYESKQFNVGRSVIVPFLYHQRIWRLHDMIITHPHKDHYNGLPFVYDRFQPQRLIVNNDIGEEPTYRSFIAAVRNNRTPVQVAKAGDFLLQEKGLRLECLGMDGLTGNQASWSANDRSLVLRLQYQGRAFLFPGDISVLSENILLEQAKSITSDVLLAPHHGSSTSSGSSFIAAVSPSLIVVSASRARQGILPAPAHLINWRQKHIATMVTATDGTITMTTDGEKLQARPFDQKEQTVPARLPDCLLRKRDLNHPL